MPNIGFARRVLGSCLPIIITLVAMLLFHFPNSVFAQVGRSAVTGIVTDPTGAVVPNAKVTIRNEATNVEWTTTTTDTGVYIVRDLSPGSYSVAVESSGFEKVVVEHARLEVDKVSSADVKLTVGMMTQTLEVTAAATDLNTTSGTIGNLVGENELETLPLNGRSWVNLNYLAPGVTTFVGNSMNFSNITESVAPGNVVANGLRGGNNLYFIDGVNAADVEDFILSVYPPLDALAEFRTQTGNASAEYFGGAGAMVSAATKPGTNDFHGDLWEFVRNDALDSRDFFSPNVPELKRNQFGFTFGGPIQKDKTFFFGSYEGFREVMGVPFVGSYPTQAMRAGDLSSISTPIINPYTNQPIQNNNVASLINPLSTKWLNDWIPLPNTNLPLASGNYIVTIPQPIDYDSYIVRGDHRFGEKSNIFLRYLWSKADSYEPVIIQGFTRHQFRPGINIALDYTRTFTHTVVAEGRFGYHRYDDNETVDNSTNTNMESELGVLGAVGFTNSPYSELAPPYIGVSGLSEFGDIYFGRPRRILNTSFYYDGLVFVARGGHAVKMGLSVTHNQAHFPETILPTGWWTYDGTFTGNGFADFLLGIPRSIQSLPDEFEPNNRRWVEGLWFQDDWKVRSRLTLNLGMRWDRDGGYQSVSNGVANFDVSTPPVALCYTVRNRPANWAPDLFDAPWNKMFAPRLGFAYKAATNTVIRGAYGIYWEPMTADPDSNMATNPPLVRSYSFTLDPSEIASFNRANPIATSAAVGLSAQVVPYNFQPGYVQQWNLMIEQDVRGTLFSIGYVGNAGHHLVSYGAYDVAQPGPGPLLPRLPFTELLIEPNGGGILPAGIETASPMTLYESGGDSVYHALDLEAKRRFARGLSFTAAYAFAKGIDDVSEPYVEGRGLSTQQPWNPKAERAVSDFSTKNALTFSYIYTLPFGAGEHFGSGVGGAADKLIGGWQLEGLTRFEGGFPIGGIWLSYDNLNNGGGGSYANQVCDPNLSGSRGSGARVAMFFNTSCFTTPQPYTFGNANRSSVIGPGTELWDIALQKGTRITERLTTQFRAELFNAFNHPNFNFPNNIYGTPEFGTITSSAAAPRQVQFGLKLIF